MLPGISGQNIAIAIGQSFFQKLSSIFSSCSCTDQNRETYDMEQIEYITYLTEKNSHSVNEFNPQEGTGGVQIVTSEFNTVSRSAISFTFAENNNNNQPHEMQSINSDLEINVNNLH